MRRLYIRILSFVCVALVTASMFAVNIVHAESDSLFVGDGTKANPYLISNASDMLKLADSVNGGNSYEKCYFTFTNDIDMSGVEMVPIGRYSSGKYFFGTLDGKGYALHNLHIDVDGNCGLFGALGGTVINLGIESGSISGQGCNGAISSHSASKNAKIINCYNLASVSGSRAGGIADNFNGTIFNCWSDCLLSGDSIGGISGYSVTKAGYSYSTNPLFGKDCDSVECYQVSSAELNSSTQANKMNDNAFATLFSETDYSDLNKWEYNKKTGSLVLSHAPNSLGLRAFMLYVKSNKVFLFPWVLLVLMLIVAAVRIFRRPGLKQQ